MIADVKELAVAARNLTILETSLQALHEQLRAQNPNLLEVTARPYERRIASLQSDIAHYLSEHPPAVSLIVAARIQDETPEFALVGTP